jgi:protein-serine/threonine kinase
MGLFTRSKRDSALPAALVKSKSASPPAPSKGLKALFKREAAAASAPPTALAAPDAPPKRISTIVEDLNAALDLDDLDFDDLDDLASSASSSSSASDSTPHTHAVKALPKASTLSSLMAYCGLHRLVRDAADEELRRTFSLLDPTLKIFTVSSTTNRADARLRDPVINEAQLETLRRLTAKINAVFDAPDAAQSALAGAKTLRQRYGAVRSVIGRGAYGLIKIIEPEAPGATLYAVKELERRDREPRQKFVERVLLEFIISSTLNYKHIVKTVDLMVTLAALAALAALAGGGSGSGGSGGALKICQVMECTPGGNLFTYITTAADRAARPVRFVALAELDCFVKQIAKGLWFMHQHGVAHCDLKLENVLIAYAPGGAAQLKLSDFGKSTVFRTKWDRADQLTAAGQPVGLEPYIAPEEYGGGRSAAFLPAKKDVWALGVLVFVLFNVRRHYYAGSDDPAAVASDAPAAAADAGDDALPPGYPWQLTESLASHFKDKRFGEYVATRMEADYECRTKEWLVRRQGAYPAIEHLFEPMRDAAGAPLGRDERDLCLLRRMFIYKMLDPNPHSRLTVEELLRSDWMRGVDTCV